MLLIIDIFFIVMRSLEWGRSQVMIITDGRLERISEPRVFNSVLVQTLATGGGNTGINSAHV